MVELGFAPGAQRGDFWPKYREFLGLYWLTAPLAWLYAVPVERFAGAADAVRANLWLLGIVSVWRIALMTRVVSVVYARSTLAAFFRVMLFADSVALAIFWLTPLPILAAMGGIRLTESEALILSTGFYVSFLGTVTWLVWLIGATLSVNWGRGNSRGWRDADFFGPETQSVTWPLWLLAACSILVWTGILPFTQSEQVNRRLVETDLRLGRIEQAFGFMSQRDRGQFPPHWDPPPRLGYAETQPPIVDVLLCLQRVEAAPWVQELFRQKLTFQSLADPYYGHAIRLGEMEDEQLASYVKLLASLPEGPAMARYHEREIQVGLASGQTNGVADELSDSRRASLERILKLIPDDESGSETEN